MRMADVTSAARTVACGAVLTLMLWVGAAAAESRFVPFENLRVHYELDGAGEHAVVLIHGWAGHAGFWREQAPADTRARHAWVQQEMLATPQHVMASAMETMFLADRPAWDLARVDVPVLVLNTDCPMWTSDYVDYVRSLWAQTGYRAFAGAGHFFMLERPAEFSAALREMLQQFDLIGD